MATHSSILAWRLPRTESRWVPVHGVAESETAERPPRLPFICAYRPTFPAYWELCPECLTALYFYFLSNTLCFLKFCINRKIEQVLETVPTPCPSPSTVFPVTTTRISVRPLSQPINQFRSVAQSRPTLRPHGLQHARPPCPSPTPGAYSNSRPSSR